MKILALDTTAKSASAAITDGREPLAVFTLEAGLTHSETVLPMIKTALDSLHMAAHDIDLFAVTAGPGSFTGVRIGISEIKGLAFATGKPCVGVSTLLSLAYNLRPLCENAILCPVMDARRNQLYNALFRLESGVLTRLCEDRLVSLSDLTAELAGYDEPVYSAGDGYALLKKAAAIAVVYGGIGICAHINAFISHLREHFYQLVFVEIAGMVCTENNFFHNVFLFLIILSFCRLLCP